MDFALQYSPTLQSFDLMVDGATADFVREDTLQSAVVLSLLCDRSAQAHEVPAGADRRGWWADAFSQANAIDRAGSESFGSRLWLLMREKQLPQTRERVRDYVKEALAWMVEDGMAEGAEVTVFAPRAGWYVADVALQLRAGTRRFRFEWNGDAQLWHLAGELA
jgi:phage gp46-like protein